MPTRRQLPRFGLSLLALFAAVPLLAGEPADAPHWAFVPPVRPPVPAPKNADWAKHPIDAFLAAEHERRGLQPSEPAPKHVLLRRVYLDLIGLPPTPQELEAFLADTSPEAHEKVVDRLLASPRYGERWGRHWMDVWRYSDWYGYGNELRNSQKHLWRWRDWIIESLNADKPYARMIVEMLAADEAAPGDADALRATGFLARNYYKFNRNVWLDNSVEHTAKAFLGVTVNCAKCHDHKYDPIAQEGYYRFRAFFEPYKLRLDRVPGSPDPEKDGLARVYDADLDAPTYLFDRGDEKQPVKDKSLSPGLPEVLAPAGLTIRPVELPVAAYYPGAQSFVRQEAINSAREKIAKAEAALGQAKKLPAGKAATLAVSAAEKQLAAANAHLAALEARIAADEAKYASPPAPYAEELAKAAHDAAANERHLTAEADLAAAEKALADAEQALKPGDAKLKKAVEDAKKKVAELTKKRDEAKQALGKPGTDYPPLTPVYPGKSTGRRLALAKWIADEKNPLTARVAVNHVWLRHFGRPLVPTVFDFGKNGQPPTHPELLDWLAVDFMESGWSMKHLHRLIVTSRAYQQSSVPRSAFRGPRSEDPDNVYLWRMNSRRMESEIVRDSLLHVAGKLD
ncbi:MAG TPA: DUF1549 domain-containing protein, partial [Gemmataceae bacterium]